MSEAVWLTPWMKSDINMSEVVENLDQSIEFEYVSISDVSGKHAYDVFHCPKKYIPDIVEYFLEHERRFTSPDFEILGAMILERKEDKAKVLNIALGYKIADENDPIVKGNKPFTQTFIFSKGVLYDKNYRKIKDFKEKVFS